MTTVWENHVCCRAWSFGKVGCFFTLGPCVYFVPVKGLPKALFMTLSSNAFEGSRPTYPPSIPHLHLGQCGSVGSTASWKPGGPGFDSRFRQISGLDSHFRPLSSKEKSGKALQGNAFSEAQTHVPRLLFLGWWGHESAFWETLVPVLVRCENCYQP